MQVFSDFEVQPEQMSNQNEGGGHSNRIINIEFDARLRIESAIDEVALKEEFGNDLLRYVKYLVDEEGMLGCVDIADSSTIVAAREYSI